MRAKVLITSTAVAGLLALAPTTALASTAGGADLAAMTCHHGSCAKTASANVPKSTDRGSGDDKRSGVDRGKGDDKTKATVMKTGDHDKAKAVDNDKDVDADKDVDTDTDVDADENDEDVDTDKDAADVEIGRASCRERV